jgi:hypothetical protein
VATEQSVLFYGAVADQVLAEGPRIATTLPMDLIRIAADFDTTKAA